MTWTAQHGAIASQWGEALDARVRARRPGLVWHALPAGVPAAPLPDDARVLLVRPFPPADRQAPAPAGWPGGLRWVQLASVGVDFYPDWLLRTPGLPVSTAHGTSSETIADFALASILRVQLRLVERRAAGAADWQFTEAPALAGSTLGVLGFGGIGQALARKALVLGLRVLALRRSDAPLPVPGVERAADLGDLLRRSDHLVLAAPGTAETRHLIDAQALAQARPGLHLVNVARGSLVDQTALRTALDEGRLGWASLDVSDPEPLPEGHWLYDHPRVWLTPHTSPISAQVYEALADRVVQGLDRLAEGAQPEHVWAAGRAY